ncbi:MAG: bile acid:sodium symporter family protein [Phenylobacterium sp.]
MTPAELITLALKASIITMVFALGLRTSWSDVTYLLRHPGQLAKSLLSMNLIMPVVASIIVLVFSLRPPVSMVLIALSLCPTPPVLPNKMAKAGGNPSYGVSLMAVCAVAAIVTIPLLVEVIERLFGIPLHMPPAAVAKLVAIMMIVPLVAGVIVHRLAGGLAETLSKWLSRIATVVLLCGLAAILVASWGAMVDQIGGGTLIAIAAFCVVGLLVGHLLGGPDSTDRTVLAIATASRHPGLAIAIAQVNFPDQKGLLPTVLIYLLVSAICSLPYVTWRKRLGAALPVSV